MTRVAGDLRRQRHRARRHRAQAARASTTSSSTSPATAPRSETDEADRRRPRTSRPDAGDRPMTHARAPRDPPDRACWRQSLVDRPPQLPPHQADARDADRRHHPAGDVRAALRLRLRLVDRRADAAAGYRAFLLPGIMAQTVAFASFIVAVGLTADLEKGIVDRMRSLPINPAAVLVGPQHLQPGPLLDRPRRHVADRPAHRLAHPHRRVPGGLRLRPAPRLGLRDDLGRHLGRLRDALGRGGQRRHVRDDVPASPSWPTRSRRPTRCRPCCGSSPSGTRSPR